MAKAAQGTASSSAAAELHEQHVPHRIGFPYAGLDDLTEGMPGLADADDMVEMLAPFLMDGRVERIEKVVAQRTFSVLPIVEGLYNMGNLAAVCRSSDGGWATSCEHGVIV